MSVLVDISIWIDYFRSGNSSERLDFLIDENLVVINDLILAELVPSLEVRGQRKLINLLQTITQLELTIDWKQIVRLQFQCLKNGLNGIGIPDLILVQNAKQNGCKIYSLDNPFRLMKDILEFRLVD